MNSASGSDSNSGASSSLAVKTIATAINLASQSSAGSTIVLADGVYRETISLPAATASSGQGPLVFRSASGDSSKVSIRCSNQISGASFQLLPASLAGPFPPAARSQIYTADLSALGWQPTDLLRFRDDSNWEQKASGLNFLVQSSPANAAGSPLDPSRRYLSARSPNFQNITNWKRAEYWWQADGPVGGSTTQLVDATDDVVPSDIQKGNLQSVGQDLSGGYIRSLDGLNSHWVWYRKILSHDVSSGTVTIDTDTSGSCDSSTGACSGCQPLYACGDANIDTNGNGFSPVSKYYVDNHPFLLDSPGEYFVDKAAMRLYLIPPTNVVVDASFTVELSKRRIAVDLSNTANITFDSINFEMCDDTVFWSNNWDTINTQQVTLRSLTLQLSGSGLIFIKGIGPSDQPGGNQATEHIVLRDSVVRHTDDVFLTVSQGWWGCNPSTSVCAHTEMKNFYIGNNQFYEIGFQPFGDDGSGAGLIANQLVFENNLVRNVAHNGMEFVPGQVVPGAVYPYADNQLLVGNVLIKDNVFEWTCLLESDCGGLKHYTGDYGFRSHLIMGNVFRNIIGWSVAAETHNLIPTDWPYYNPVTRAYWSTMLGFAFGSYFDYAPGSYHFRNIAYNIGTNAYQWTNRIAEMEAYFHNNLAVNCYNGFAATWSRTQTLGNNDTSIQGNIFAAIAHNGLQLERSGQTNGVPRSFAGKFAMDYNLWTNVGYDNRTDSVYRRGVADIGYTINAPNGGNPTSTLAGLRALEPSVSQHDALNAPAFVGFNAHRLVASVLNSPQSATLTSYLTDNQVDWTAFAIDTTDPASMAAVDKLPALPPRLKAQLTQWGLVADQTGSALDVGPLESGITWTAAMKGPQSVTALTPTN